MSESMTIFAAYAIFMVATIIACQLRPLICSAAICYFGGWLLLPVAHYPADTITAGYFTVNVIGTALPSNLGLTKAWVVPVSIILGITLKTPRIWSTIRLNWSDAFVLAYCVWPIFAMLIAQSDKEVAVYASF